MKKEYSNYNSGQPLKAAIVPTLAQTINLFDKLRRTGKVFRVDFIKRGDGTMRTMVCRFGVKKYLRGGKRAYDAGDKGLFLVWEFGVGYRSITIDNMVLLKTAGVAYFFDPEIKPGIYANVSEDPSMIGLRTVPSSTSPIFERAEV